MDYEYERNGTRKLLAAFNPHTGEVYGESREHRRAADLVEFMEALARRHPTGEVHIVWDNLNIHLDGAERRWTRFNARHGNRFHFHYTPLHASWVNQIELESACFATASSIASMNSTALSSASSRTGTRTSDIRSGGPSRAIPCSAVAGRPELSLVRDRLVA